MISDREKTRSISEMRADILAEALYRIASRAMTRSLSITIALDALRHAGMLGKFMRAREAREG